MFSLPHTASGKGLQVHGKFSNIIHEFNAVWAKGSINGEEYAEIINKLI
jgi:hypothetical protein